MWTRTSYARPRRLRRRSLWFVVALVSVTAMTVIAYLQVTSTRPVSRGSALKTFQDQEREQRGPISSGSSEVSSGEGAATPSQGIASPSPGNTRKGLSSQSRETVATDEFCEWACFTSTTAPESGVYRYFQCGRVSGQCDGTPDEPQGEEGGAFAGVELNRKFPRVGFRSLTREGTQGWRRTHLAHEENEQTFELTIDPSQVLVHRYMHSVTALGRTYAVDIRMRPPLVLVQIPPRDGQSWRGQWFDTNRDGDGSYSVKVIGREEINIEGKRVRTWVGVLDIRLIGPSTIGKFSVKGWFSPESRDTVQEQYDIDITKDGNAYHGRWMVTLSSMNPEH